MSADLQVDPTPAAPPDPEEPDRAHPSTRQGRSVRIAVVVIAVGLLALLLYPIGRMIVRALFPDGSLDLSPFARTVAQPWFWPVMGNTLLVVGVSSVIALLIGALLAWLNERTDASLGWLGTIMPLLPLLMPPIATAAGWVFLATPDIGFINGFLSILPGDLSVNVLSRSGLIFVYVLELVPFAYIPIAGALRNLDPSLEEASLVSGAGVAKTTLRVSLPAVSQALVSAYFLLVVVGFALYSAPVVIGTNANIDILSVRIVRLMQFTFPADLQSATVLSTILLVIVLGAWLLQNKVTSRGRYAMISGRGGQARISLGRWKNVFRGGAVLYIVITTVLPLLAVVVVALQPYWKPGIDVGEFSLRNFEQVFRRPKSTSALQNSVLLGLVGGALAVAVCALVVIARRRSSFGTVLGPRFGRFIESVMRLPAAFSAIVIALGFIVAFSGPPFNWNGTIVILMLCYVVNFMPQAATTTGNALSQIGGDLTEASYISKAGELRTTSRIVLPLARPGLLSAWSLLFVLIAGELAASTLLAGARTPVIGFVLVEIWENGTVGPMAAFACVVTVVMVAAVLLALLGGRQRYRRVGRR